MKSKLLPKLYLFLGILSFLVYSNTLNHDYVLDDFSVIKDNFVVKQGLEGIPTIFKTHYRYGYGYQTATLYRPLSLSLFALQWELAPDQASLAHLTNLIAYALLVCLIFFFLNKLFGKEKLWLSFFSAFLFALHPIHTEVVANIKSIDEIMAFAFCLLSLIYLLTYVESKHKKELFFSLSFFAIAFFFKESTIAFLAVVPLTLILFRDFPPIKAIKTSLPFLLPTAIYLISRRIVLGSFGGNKAIAVIDNVLVGAPNAGIKLASALKIMLLHPYKLLFPKTLMNDYSLNVTQLSSWSDPLVWLSLLFYATLIIILFKTWKHHKIIAFCIAFFLINTALYTNIFITIGTPFGERLLFIASLAFCILLAYAILGFFKLNQHVTSFKKLSKPMVLFALIGVVYAFKTIDRNQAWKDNFTLYATDVKNCSESARCQYYYGLGLMKEKALKSKNEKKRTELIQEAIKAFDRAVSIYPTYSDAYGQRGLAYYRMGNYEAALYDYKQAVKHLSGNANAWSNMGTLLFEQGRYQEAKQAFEKALQANPNHVDALANYGSTLGTLGEFNTAITYFKRAIALKPDEPSYYQMVGMTYQNLNKPTLAQPYLKKANALRQNQ